MAPTLRGVSFLERLGAASGGGAVGLGELWDSLADDDHAGRLIVAHYLADVQPDPADEVRWDDAARALDLSIAHNDRLPDDLPEQAAYRQLIVGGQQRLGGRIRERDSSSVVPGA